MAKKSIQTKNNQSSISTFIEGIRKERPRFLIGVSTAFLGAFMLLSILSFFFTGAADQSKVMNKSFFELISNKQIISNWTGVAGAFISEHLVNQWFGIFSVIIPIFFIAIGFKLMRISRISAARALLLSTFAIIWGSITSAFTLSRLFPDSYIIWGGAHGHYMERLLENTIGIPGVIMAIILLLIIFLIISKKASVEFFRKIFAQPVKRNPIAWMYEESDDDNNENEIEETVKETKLKDTRHWFDFVKKKNKPSEKEAESSDNLSEPVSQKQAIAPNRSETLHVDNDFEIVISKEE